MFALFGRSDHLADVLAVLEYSVAFGEILDSNFVADRNVGLRFDREIRIVMRHDAQHLGAGGQALDDDDADVVLVIMHE